MFAQTLGSLRQSGYANVRKEVHSIGPDNPSKRGNNLFTTLGRSLRMVDD